MIKNMLVHGAVRMRGKQQDVHAQSETSVSYRHSYQRYYGYRYPEGTGR